MASPSTFIMASAYLRFKRSLFTVGWTDNGNLCRDMAMPCPYQQEFGNPIAGSLSTIVGHSNPLPPNTLIFSATHPELLSGSAIIMNISFEMRNHYR
jgi:hypothetical protein